MFTLPALLETISGEFEKRLVIALHQDTCLEKNFIVHFSSVLGKQRTVGKRNVIIKWLLFNLIVLQSV